MRSAISVVMAVDRLSSVPSMLERQLPAAMLQVVEAGSRQLVGVAIDFNRAGGCSVVLKEVFEVGAFEVDEDTVSSVISMELMAPSLTRMPGVSS